jgi:mono/diheme cytochrome c family protein
MRRITSNRRWGILVLVVLAAIGIWWMFFRSGEQELAEERERFHYGSLGGELIAGIPYPIFMILPRVFPDLIETHARDGYGLARAGHGGYGAFGLPWEEGRRLPVGLSVRQLGYDRVTVNCAFCHTTTYRLAPTEAPQLAVGGPGHTVDVQALLRFLFAAAEDRRFNAIRLMPEIALHFDMNWIDWALYSFVLIPKTRLALQLARRQMAWADGKPPWGPGRDDAFNLPKYILTQSPWDETVGNTDFPALWRLANRDGGLLHAGGEALSLRAVIATSALGTGSLPFWGFDGRLDWLEGVIRNLEPPAFPGNIDAALAARGRELFASHCAACHAVGGARTGSAIPLEEIGTDPEHVLTWRDKDAVRMNRVTRVLGIERAEMQAAKGYVAKPLVGVWLLAPYLHNGSVPSLRELLSPPEMRPSTFARGYDVIDLENVGFDATSSEARAHGFHFDTSLKGNGNGGHSYGTDLPEADKRALIEHLKTL